MKKRVRINRKRKQIEKQANQFFERSFFFWLARACAIFMTIFYFKLYLVELQTALENMPVLHVPLIVASVLFVTIIMWNQRGVILGLFYIATGILYVLYSEKIFLSVSVLALSYLLILIGLMFLFDTFQYWLSSKSIHNVTTKKRTPVYASEVNIKELILKNNEDKNG